MELKDYAIFENFFEPILVCRKDFVFIYANQAFGNLFEYSIKRLKVGKNIAELLPENHEVLEQSVKTTSIFQDFIMSATSGTSFAMQICVENVSTEAGESYLFYFHDISLEKRLQHKYKLELQQKEGFIQKLDRKLFEVSFLLQVSDGLSRKGNRDEIFNWTLQLISKKFGFRKAACLQLESGAATLITAMGDPEETSFWQNILDLGDSEDTWVRVKTSSTQTVQGVLLFEKQRPISPEDWSLLNGAGAQIFARLERELLYSNSITDAKTGLFNSRFLQAAMAQEIERTKRNAEPFGVIMIDIDHFKKFNDEYGHQIGDNVLVHVANCIKDSLRQSDLAARFGGEEFCIIAVKTNPEGLFVVMERIRKRVESLKLRFEEFGELGVTISLGGAMYSEKNRNSSETLISAADKALYEAKSTGRNRSIFSPA